MLLFGRRVRRPVARFAGSRRRHLGSRRRNAERHPDRAGIHARRAARPALRRCGREELRHRRAPHARARLAHRARHHDHVLGGHAGVVAGRAFGARRHHVRRRSREIPELRDFHGHRRSRRCRRCGASCSARPAPWNAPSSCCDSRPSIVTPGAPGRARGAARADPLRASELQLSLAARHARARRLPSRHRAGRNRGVRRPFGRRQEHGVPAAAAFL